jgi:excisionase family DNA binding protein
MKQTHKFEALGDVAAVVGRAASVSAAARQLGVERSTVQRWIKAGKISRPSTCGAKPAATGGPASRARKQSPESWARWVRRTYDLTATEQTLVDLAERALTLATDATTRAEVRLTATTRYQQLVKQLDLENETDGEVEKAPRGRCITWPRRIDGTAAGA